MKKASMGLIATGLVFLVYGLFMDTSISSYGERVHNIGLMNDRLAMLMAGGFIFLGGIVVFSLWKIKSPNNTAQNGSDQTDNIASDADSRTSSSVWNLARSFKDRPVFRLLTGVISGFLMSGYIPTDQNVFWVANTVSICFFTLLVLRNIPAHIAIRQTLFTASLGWMAVLFVHYSNKRFYSSSDVVIDLLPAAVFVGVALMVKNKSPKKA